MNPLFLNDAQGEFPPSWYAATVDTPELRPALDGDRTADVVIVGGGFTGLSAALTAARGGLDTVLVDAHRAGFGASGRNGGQVGSGFRENQMWLEKRLGPDIAKSLWKMSEDAKAQVRDWSAEFAPEARYLPGVAHGEYSQGELDHAKEEIDFLADRYGYDQMDLLQPDAFRDLVKTDKYHGGSLDRGAGHIHPLRYALGIARAAESAGATIFEKTEVTGLERGAKVRVTTRAGTITADHVILAGNGYLPNLDRRISARVMPINSFIAATEPLGDRAEEVLGQDIAVADSKFVVNYYRMSEDRRFLFGGRESYTLGFPSDITTQLRKRMLALFPQLEGVGFDYVWGGTLGITMTRLPAVFRLEPNILTASGFSGHGVALSGFCGRVMAEAVLGQAGRFDVLTKLPGTPFPGGATFRAPLLTLAMTWYSLRDRLGF
jgi:gamma-glutamylputrescine oxidase